MSCMWPDIGRDQDLHAWHKKGRNSEILWSEVHFSPDTDIIAYSEKKTLSCVNLASIARVHNSFDKIT